MNAKTFFYDFGKTLYHIDAIYEDFAKNSGTVSPALLWILYALNDGNENHTQKEISTNWSIPKSTVNTVTTELKKNNYVELTLIKGKRREMTIQLTEDGKKYADTLLCAIYKTEEEVYNNLNLDEKKTIEYIKKIAKLLNNKI